MLKKLLTFLLISLVGVSFAFAQQQGSITGKVTDSQTGEALPGVNVILPNINEGDPTNSEGTFEITDVSPGRYLLTASFVGYQKFRQRITVEAGENTVNIELKPKVMGMENIVVTALGFEQSKDESGTSQSTVTGSEIEESGEPTVIQGLSAKAAGLRVTQSSGDPGAGARILIRGANTITGNNQPLFVIDGVPVFNSTFGQSVASVTQQSRINDLDPDNIESVEVLKGPSAAALWGSRAANGVVIIETKQGQQTEGDKIDIEVKSQVSIDELNKSVDLQRKYGQGLSTGIFTGSSTFQHGQWLSGIFSTWGDKIADRPGGEDKMDTSPGNAYIGPDGNRFGVITQKNSKETYDHSTELFGTGYKYDNSITVSGGDEDGTFLLSLTDLKQDGMIKGNSDYNRTTIRANVTRYFNKFTASFNASYANSGSDRIQKGSNLSGLLLGLYRTPPDFNNKPVTVDYIDQNGVVHPDRHRGFRNPIGANQTPIYNNPYWTANNVQNHTDVNRLTGNAELDYNPTEWLSFTHRLGLDYYTDRRYAIFPPKDSSFPEGHQEEENITQYQINSDLIARATRQLTEDLSGSILAGWNLNHRKTDQLGAIADDYILETHLRDISNASNRNPFQSRTIQRTSALYGKLNLNYAEMLFLEVTGRSESASTFGPETDNTFFYPSASLAWQFTELNTFDDVDFLNFGKLRVSYGEAGIQPSPYNTSTNFFQGDFFSSWGPSLDPTFYGGGFARSSQAGNPKLRVERTKELEYGIDLRFFNDRVELNVTRYTTETEDAILGVDRAPSSGFSEQVANAASMENKGVEVELTTEWIRSDNFSWITSANWSKNENTVTSLAGAEEVSLAGFVSATSSAVEGEPYGSLWGFRWRRSSEQPLTSAEKSAGYTVGNDDRVLNPLGFPVTADAQGIVGDPNPDWTAGIQNTFKYKNLSFDVLIDYQHGGDVWNGTKGALYFFGVHGDQVWEATADQDLKNYVGQTVPEGTTFRGQIRDFGAGPVAMDQHYYWIGPGSGFTGPTEQFIEDGGYFRLREVALRYSITGSSFRDWSGLRAIDLRASARNVLLITDYTGIDPETNLTGPSNGQGLDYFNNPNTRSLMFSVRVKY